MAGSHRQFRTYFPPFQPHTQFEQALGISRSSLGPEGAATTRDSAESIRRESDLEDPNKIVPCYGEVWVQKRNRLREKTSFAEAVGAWVVAC